jgi:transketolase|tara:strand:- start:6024 stop:6857 length:834 start_codon:yes stop_codon:yes gene_type:complete
MSNQDQITEIKNFAKQIRKNILYMSLVAGASSSHFGGSLSTVEILATLYNNILKFDSSNPLWEDRDRFILSKGHACLGYYSALYEKGYFKKEDLNLFEQNGSFLLGHPVINKKKGIEFSNGSLGMGLSLGIGVALAAKKKNKDYKVFVLIGDGECNEGSVWEASMSAAHFKLNNLTTILDNNNLQQTGTNEEIMSTRKLGDKWKSFNWNVKEIDGHDVKQILAAFNHVSEKPKLILANTIKGRGFSFSENNNDWHHNIMTKKQYDDALKELDLNDPE